MTLREPAVKGAIFGAAVADLLRLRDAGFISQEELELQLSPEELASLECKTNPAGWYPMRSYARLMQLLGELEGGSRDAYFHERGAASARRLIESGLYEQLDFLGRWEDKTRGELQRRAGDAAPQEATRPERAAMIAFFKRTLRLVVSLARNIYSVGDWRVEVDPDHPQRVRIEIRDAGSYTDEIRYAIEGFLNECGHAIRPDLPCPYTSFRLSSDVIVFKMNLDIPDLYERVFG